MENNYKNGINWNLHENLKAFKSGEQNRYKTVANIKQLYIYKAMCEKNEMLAKFESIQESERIRLESGK